MAAGTIAVVIRELEGPYQEQLIPSLRQAALAHGFTLGFFPGRGLGSTSEFERQFAVTYDQAIAAPLVGAIVVSGTLARDADPSLISRMIARLASRLPTVCIGPTYGQPLCEIGGDDAQGIDLLVKHLIEVHGCRRFGYLHGPPQAADERARYGALTRALAAAGLQLRPEHEAWGDFNIIDGMAAARTLLPFVRELDVLVAANDAMAAGAISVLLQAGVMVPRDIRVVGYDDIYGSGLIDIPITSVSQNPDAQARLAMEALVGLHQQPGSMPLQIKVPATLRTYTSCGCGHHLLLEASRPDELGSSLPEWAQGFARVFCLQLGDGSIPDAVFLEQFGDFTRLCIERGVASPVLSDLLQQLEAEALPESPPAPYASVRKRLVLASALVALTQYPRRGATPLFRFNSQTFAGNLREGLRGHRREDLQRALFDALTLVGLRSAYIVIYQGVGAVSADGQSSVPQESRVIFGMSQGNLLDMADVPFSSRSLLPWHTLDASGLGDYVVQPLFNQGDHYGFCVLGLEGSWRVPLEEIRDGISSVICGKLVVAELERSRDRLRQELERATDDHRTLSDQALQDELTGLANRRGLMRALQQMAGAGLPCSLLLMDMDDLKYINDHFGHAEGDRALLAFAEALRTAMSPGAACGRLGGDEFAVIHPGRDAVDVAAVCKRLRRQVADYNQRRQESWTLAYSLGVASIEGAAVSDFVSALRIADEQLYQEKSAHKRARAERRREPPAQPAAS